MRRLTCIVCPRGCALSVDEENGYAVTGNACPRGARYGKTEATAPTRTVTATARVVHARRGSVDGGDSALEGYSPRRVPVKASESVPRERVIAIAGFMQSLEVTLPVREGDVVARDWEGTGIDVVVTRTME